MILSMSSLVLRLVLQPTISSPARKARVQRMNALIWSFMLFPYLCEFGECLPIGAATVAALLLLVAK